MCNRPTSGFYLTNSCKWEVGCSLMQLNTLTRVIPWGEREEETEHPFLIILRLFSKYKITKITRTFPCFFFSNLLSLLLAEEKRWLLLFVYVHNLVSCLTCLAFLTILSQNYILRAFAKIAWTGNLLFLFFKLASGVRLITVVLCCIGNGQTFNTMLWLSSIFSKPSWK